MKPEMRNRVFDDYLRKSEGAIYVLLAVLLSITALVTIAGAGQMLWQTIVHWTVANEILRVLDQLLLVLMLVEILHTVRITVRSHILLAAEPFLVVGLIASIRRILVISLEMSTLTKGDGWAANGESVFHASMLELGLLILLVLVLVFSITLLRRYAPVSEDTATQ
jgi:Phosphate-starvation-inducible E family